MGWRLSVGVIALISRGVEMLISVNMGGRAEFMLIKTLEMGGGGDVILRHGCSRPNLELQ